MSEEDHSHSLTAVSTGAFGKRAFQTRHKLPPVLTPKGVQFTLQRSLVGGQQSGAESRIFSESDEVDNLRMALPNKHSFFQMWTTLAPKRLDAGLFRATGQKLEVIDGRQDTGSQVEQQGICFDLANFPVRRGRKVSPGRRFSAGGGALGVKE